MKIPRITQCCCCGLKTGNIFWCWIEFFTILSGLVISTYVFFIHGLNGMPVILSIDDYFHPYKYSVGFFLIGAETVCAVICLFFIHGIRKKKPEYLLPFTFKNAGISLIFILYGACFLNLLGIIGVFYMLVAISNYSLYDEILDENQRKLTIAQMEMQSIHPVAVPVYQCDYCPAVNEQWVPSSCDIVTYCHMFPNRARYCN
ncbi:hypothetical protein ACKWTF_014580 [Chironomus riparius]